MATDENKPVDTLELLKRAEAVVQQEQEKERQRKMRRAVQAEVSYRKKTLDPFDVLDIEPPLTDEEWKATPLTHNQIMWLERSGIDTEMMTVAQQRAVLNTMINRKKRNLATPKQVKLLKRFNYSTKNLSFADASALITRLANNNWKRP